MYYSVTFIYMLPYSITKQKKIMITYIIKENVVSNNVLLIADNGKVFKGGFIAIVKEFEYVNAWQDRQKPNKGFRNEKILYKFLSKNYPDFIF